MQTSETKVVIISVYLFTVRIVFSFLLHAVIFTAFCDAVLLLFVDWAYVICCEYSTKTKISISMLCYISC